MAGGLILTDRSMPGGSRLPFAQALLEPFQLDELAEAISRLLR